MTDRPLVAVVVPGEVDAGPLVDAVRRQHPDWEIRTIWAGDPELRPAGHEAVDLDELTLARVEPDARPILVAAHHLGARGDRPVVVLVAGRVAVAGPLDALVPEPGRLVVVPRLLDAAEPGGYPTLAELAAVGTCSTSVLGVGPGAGTALAWISARLDDPDPAPLGTLLGLGVIPADRCGDPSIGASVWRWGDGPPALLEAPNHDPRRPWLLDPELAGPPRTPITDPDRAAFVASVADQLGSGVLSIGLPGGLEVDDVVRHILRHDPPVGLRPWSDAAAVRRHIERRYWAVAHELRPQLRWRFPSPFGADAQGFARWAAQAGFIGEAPILLDPADAITDLAVRRTDERTDGVNVVGYLHHQSGVGNIARRVVEILERQGIAHSAVAFGRTENPRLVDPPSTDQELRYSTSIVVVNGDQVPVLRSDVPELFGEGRRVIGIWFWELDSFEGGAGGGDRLVDEIWATTTFMAGAFRSLGTAPVSVVPIPFDRPVARPRPLSSFPPLDGVDGIDDRFVFGVVYDHFSVTERKNPLGAIRAFREAFDPDDGPVLVVKSINGHRHWREQEQVRAAAAGRDDIVVWDELLTRTDHVDFIASLDALVSLHRSEGVGLHLAEAMSLGVPVIATRYSGNLDFMDDDTAYLVDAALVPVGDDGGWAYPSTARWAAPDLSQAATAMRSVVTDRERREAVVAAARASIGVYADEAAFADRVRAAFDGRSRPDR
jgi:glycosyltransferase involved in cell wall biosynthesis